MALQPIPNDYKEFLKSLNNHGVEYLLIGGFAVVHHGYPRTTVDLDVWVAVSSSNADRIVAALRAFGFDVPSLHAGLFLNPDKVNRLGVAPVRIEIHTGIAGVNFDECYPKRTVGVLGGVEVPIISLADLKRNKIAAGRAKDLADLEQFRGLDD